MKVTLHRLASFWNDFYSVRVNDFAFAGFTERLIFERNLGNPENLV